MNKKIFVYLFIFISTCVFLLSTFTKDFHFGFAQSSDNVDDNFESPIVEGHIDDLFPTFEEELKEEFDFPDNNSENQENHNTNDDIENFTPQTKPSDISFDSDQQSFDEQLIKNRLYSIYIDNLNFDEFSNNYLEIIDIMTTEILLNKLYVEDSLPLLYENLSFDESYGIELLKKAYGILMSKANYEQLSNDLIESNPNNILTIFDNFDSDFDSKVDDNHGLHPEYLKSIDNDVKLVSQSLDNYEVDSFRKYQVTMGIDTFSAPSTKQYHNHDIILAIDNSLSMSDNFEYLKQSAIKFVENIVDDNNSLLKDNAIKISILTFSDNSEIVLDFNSNKSEILNNIKNLTISSHLDVDNTNMQSAILKARQMFGIDPNQNQVTSENSTRKKAFVLFSDGVLNMRSTDIWDISTNPFEYSKIKFESNYEYGDKRWSYLKPSSWDYGLPVPEKIYLPFDDTYFLAKAEHLDNFALYQKQKEFIEKITLLESQFLVAQGVDIFTFTFSDNPDNILFMQNLPNRLRSTPNFDFNGYSPLQTISTNILNYYDFDYVDNSSYAYSEFDNFVENFSSNLDSSNYSKFSSYHIENFLNPEFEFDSNSFIISNMPFGEDAISDISSHDISFYDDKLVWTLPKDLQDNKYYITFYVKVKDFDLEEDPFAYGVSKLLYGKNALESAFFSKNSFLKFDDFLGQNFEYAYKDLDIIIQPNLQVDFDCDIKNILLGEDVNLKSHLVSGTGFYEFELYQITDSSKDLLSQDKIFRFENAVDFDLGSKIIMPVLPGKYIFELYVKDILSQIEYTKQIPINVFEPIININILSNDKDFDLSLPFETKVIALNSEKDIKSIFDIVGLSNTKVDFEKGKNFLKRGTSISVDTYVPYGYSIKNSLFSKNKTSAIIEIVEDADGNFSGFEHTFDIEISKNKSNKYLFYWTWISDFVSKN